MSTLGKSLRAVEGVGEGAVGTVLWRAQFLGRGQRVCGECGAVSLQSRAALGRGSPVPSVFMGLHSWS